MENSNGSENETRFLPVGDWFIPLGEEGDKEREDAIEPATIGEDGLRMGAVLGGYGWNLVRWGLEDADFRLDWVDGEGPKAIWAMGLARLDVG